MRLTIETISRKNVSVDVAPTDTVRTLKQRLYQSTGLRPRTQRLSVAAANGRHGRALTDSLTVEQSQLDENSRLRLQPALRGSGDEELYGGCAMACLAIFIISCSLMGVSVSVLKPNEYGVDYNMNMQKIDWDVYSQGRHYLGVAHKFKRWPRQWIWYNVEEMPSRTYDGMSCDVDVNVLYSIRKDSLKDMYEIYGRKYKKNLVKPIVRAEIRNVVAKYTAFELVSMRPQLADDMLVTLQDKFDDLFIDVQDVHLVSIGWPEELENAITATAVAVEDVAKAQSEYNIAVISAETEIQAARSLSQTAVYTANATAQETIADGEADAAEYGYYAEAEAAWMQYASYIGHDDTTTSANLTTTSKEMAGTNFTIPALLQYTWLKYVVRDEIAAKIIKTTKPRAIPDTP